MHLDGSGPTDLARFSEEFFREVFLRALKWRRGHPRALIEEQRAALERIVHRAEVVFDVQPSERPADALALLLWDLRATLWRDNPAPLDHLEPGLPAGYLMDRVTGRIVIDRTRFPRLRASWDRFRSGASGSRASLIPGGSRF